MYFGSTFTIMVFLGTFATIVSFNLEGKLQEENSREDAELDAVEAEKNRRKSGLKQMTRAELMIVQNIARAKKNLE